MQSPNRLALYEQRLVSLWERLVTTLGIHTVRVLLDRALWQTAQRHPEIALIHHDSGLTFDALEKTFATRPEEEIEAAFTDLVAEMLRDSGPPSRLSTGIDPLDAVLGGGIPQYSAVFVSGLPGTGKTILSQQV